MLLLLPPILLMLHCKKLCLLMSSMHFTVSRTSSSRLIQILLLGFGTHKTGRGSSSERKSHRLRVEKQRTQTCLLDYVLTERG